MNHKEYEQPPVTSTRNQVAPPEAIDGPMLAYSINEFSRRYGISRSLTYQQIKAGLLTATKVGRRTLIAAEDARDWLRRLKEAQK